MPGELRFRLGLFFENTMEKIKGYLEKKEGEIIGIASTSSRDRDGESISQEGWDLESFKRNPVLLVGHNYSEYPVGKATDISVQDGKLVFKAVFSEATQKAKEAYQLVKEGILSAFSVGFIPRDFDRADPSIITKAELLEISLVPVPANPEAVVLAKSFSEKNEIAQYIVKNFLEEKKPSEDPDIKEVKEAEKEEAEARKELEKEITAGVGEDKTDEAREEGDTASEIDLKLLQQTVGHLQILCRDLKRKGGEKI
jgi:HK97 family phage prohead protease